MKHVLKTVEFNALTFALNCFGFLKCGKKTTSSKPKRASPAWREMQPVRRVRVLGSVLEAEMCPLDEPATAAFVDLRLKYLFKASHREDFTEKTSELLGFFFFFVLRQ